MITINQIYTDLDPDLEKAWNNDITKTTGLTAVKNSMIGIITTRKGTRPFLPEFGCGLSDQLFENMNPLTADTLSKNIVSAINAYEPRVSSISCNVDSVYDDNSLIVTIYFSVIDNPDTINELKLSIEKAM